MPWYPSRNTKKKEQKRFLIEEQADQWSDNNARMVRESIPSQIGLKFQTYFRRFFFVLNGRNDE